MARRDKARAEIEVVVNSTQAAQGAAETIGVVKNMETQVDKSTASAGKKVSQNLNKGIAAANQQLQQLGTTAQTAANKVNAALSSVDKHIQKRAADIELERTRQTTVGMRNQGIWTQGAQRIERSSEVGRQRILSQLVQRENNEIQASQRAGLLILKEGIQKRGELRRQENVQMRKDYDERRAIIKRAMNNPELLGKVNAAISGDVNQRRRSAMMGLFGMTQTEAFAAQLGSLGAENVNYLVGASRAAPVAFGGRDRDQLKYEQEAAGYWNKVYAERSRLLKAEESAANKQMAQIRRENARIDSILDKMRNAPAGLQAQVANILRSEAGRQQVSGLMAGGMSPRLAYRQALSGIGGVGGGGASFLTGGGGPPPPGWGPPRPSWFQGAIGGAGRFLGASLGVGIGAYAVGNLMRGAGEDVDRATAYDRQSVAAEKLAGSQAKLNALLDAYQEASGGAVDKSEALASLSRLLATGYADTSEEVERFVRATRGAAIAMGQQQDYVVQETQLAMSNTSFRRLDQIGLGIDEVRKRMSELRAENSTLNRETAFQIALMDVMDSKYGALSGSLEGQKTEVEQLGAAWKDMRLQLGQTLQAPVNNIARYLTERVQELGDAVEEFSIAYGKADRAFNRFFGIQGPSIPSDNPFVIGQPQPGVGVTGASAEELELRAEWFKQGEEIEEEAGKQIVEVMDEYGKQRVKTIADHEKQIAREERDFARQRLRQEKDFEEAMLDLNIDIRRREQQRDRDYAKSIEEANKQHGKRVNELEKDRNKRNEELQENYAERTEEMEEDRNDRIAELSEDHAKKLVDLEEDFAKQRENSMEQYNLSRKNAIARLDARTLYELEEQFKLEQRKAREAHEEQIADEEENLAESIEEVNKAHRKRLEDEKESLEKSIEQNNEAFEERLAEEKARLAEILEQQKQAYWEQRNEALLNDALRKEDMAEEFRKNREQEDADRAIMKSDRDADFQDQLREMEIQNGERIEQIKLHAQEQRDELNTQFEEDLAEIGIFTSEYTAKLEQVAADAAAAFNEFWDNLLEKVTAPPPEITPLPSAEKRYQGKTEAQWESDYNYNMIQANKFPEGDALRLPWEMSAKNIMDILVREFGWPNPLIPKTEPEIGVQGSSLSGLSVSDTVAPASISTFGGNTANSSTYVVAEGAINIQAAPGQSVEELGMIVEERLIAALERAAVAYA